MLCETWRVIAGSSAFGLATFNGGNHAGRFLAKLL